VLVGVTAGTVIEAGAGALHAASSNTIRVMSSRREKRM
jgi:hypothetical protein